MERTKLCCVICWGAGTMNEAPCAPCKGTGYRSGHIVAVGYDDATATIEIEYRRNKDGVAPVWQYAPIDREVYELMLDANNSPGKILAGRIKGALGVEARRMPDLDQVTV